MSLHSVGSDTKYILPASYDSVPQAFQSNKSAKPIPCSLQTTNVPALTASASASGTSIVQLPCGASAGIMINPYIRFDIQLTGGGADSVVKFKGSTHSASAVLNRVSTYINSVQIDNIQNADQVYDILFAHSTSNDWLTRDANVLMATGVGATAAASLTAAATVGQAAAKTMILPLIGALGTQQGIPLYLFNGTLQIQLDFNSYARAFCDTAGTASTGYSIANVQLVYDKISVEQAFVDKVRMDMMQGQKYVLGYTNFQSTTLATQAGNQTLNYGLNVSSLRSVVSNSVLTADLATVANQGLSLPNGLSLFQVSLDGRLINSNTLNAAANPALVFAELNKCFGRLFDASISDSSNAATYADTSFAVGVSAARCNEALAFSGSPVSVASISATVTAAAWTMTICFISDYQLLVDASGSVEIVR